MLKCPFNLMLCCVPDNTSSFKISFLIFCNLLQLQSEVGYRFHDVFIFSGEKLNLYHEILKHRQTNTQAHKEYKLSLPRTEAENQGQY